MDRKPRNRSSSLVTFVYLLGYNILSVVLWSSILVRSLVHVIADNPQTLHGSIGKFTAYTQTLAVLEVAHVLLGILRGSLVTTVIQISSRLLLVWIICGEDFDAPTRSAAYASMVLAWSVTEVVRYSFYARGTYSSYYSASASSASASASSFSFSEGENEGEKDWLKWLRYNTFWILYPIGAGSEAWCIYRTLPELAGIWYWLAVAVLCIYPPGLANQYSHMIKQRKRGNSHAKSKGKGLLAR